MPHSPSARRSSFSRAHGSPPHRNEPSQPVFSPHGKAHFAPVGGGATSARGVTALAQTMLPARPGRAHPQPGPTPTSPHPGSGVCTAPSADPRRSSERANPRMVTGKHTPWRNPVATPPQPLPARTPNEPALRQASLPPPPPTLLPTTGSMATTSLPQPRVGARVQAFIPTSGGIILHLTSFPREESVRSS